jgi:hypothetical protein
MSILAQLRGRSHGFAGTGNGQRTPQATERHHHKTATARKLLTLIFYGLRDGQIRCLARHWTVG